MIQLITLNTSRPVTAHAAAMYAQAVRALADASGNPVSLQVQTPSGAYSFEQHPLTRSNLEQFS